VTEAKAERLAQRLEGWKVERLEGKRAVVRLAERFKIHPKIFEFCRRIGRTGHAEARREGRGDGF
jgi:hypothetical protein